MFLLRSPLSARKCESVFFRESPLHKLSSKFRIQLLILNRYTLHTEVQQNALGDNLLVSFRVKHYFLLHFAAEMSHHQGETSIRGEA